MNDYEIVTARSVADLQERVRELMQSGMRPLGGVEDVDRLPTAPAGGTLYDALAAMLTVDALNVVVVDGDRPIGTVSRSAIFEVPNETAPTA